MTDIPPIDLWSGLDHKVGMSPDVSGGVDGSPEWVTDPDHVRRLNAYLRIRALMENVGRRFVEDDPDDPEKSTAWLEFGDAAVMVGRQAHGVLGEDPQLVVIGADRTIPPAPVLPPAPTAPDADEAAEGRDPRVAAVETTAYEAALDVWEENAAAIIEMWQADASEIPALQERQDWLQQWADDEQLMATVFENETENIVPLGTGIYVLDWDADLARVTVRIYEPETYFPVLDDSEISQFPSRIHLAWDFIDPATEDEMVRRITYELVRFDGEDEDAEDVDPGTRPAYLAADDSWTHTCLLTDMTWKASDLESVDAPEVTGTAREATAADGTPIVLDRYPIGLDFIPVVAVQNTQSSVSHFGRSPLVRLAQLLDEISATDTDEALASRYAARPPLGVSGMSATAVTENDVDVSPGVSFALADNGRVSTINMAEHLEQIVARRLDLLKRLSVNGQVPEGLLGRVDADEVPSGLALTLSFTSFEQLVEAMRLARTTPYRLIPKFVQRIAIQAGDESIGDPVVYPAEIRFGAFMPQDLAGQATIIKSLTEARALSQETAILMARDAGVPVEDPQAELASIRRTMADVGDQLTAALEDTRHAAEFMGYTLADDADASPALPPPDDDGPVVNPPDATV